MSSPGLEPTEIAVVRSNGETLLVARDAGGAYEGVVCPPGLDSILESFISPTNPALVPLWKEYRDSKGESTFFWDVVGIAEGLRDLETIPRVRRLLNFSSPGELLHNSWQARLMRVAVAQGRQVEILRASPAHRQPDFQVNSCIPVEIKVSITDSAIEVSNEGARLSPPDVHRVARGIKKKFRDGLEQVGPNGVVVVALWCDLAANAIDRLGDSRPISTIDLTPGTFILALGPSVGSEPHTAVVLPTGAVDQFAKSLGDRLMEFTQPISLPFTGRLVGVSNRAQWTSIGRTIKIANWTEQYAPYEVPVAPKVRLTADDEAWASLMHAFRAAGEAMTEYKTLIQRSPLETRVYSAVELNTDPRFTSLFRWASLLLKGLVLLQDRPQLFQEVLPEGRPNVDATRFVEATLHPDGRLHATGLLQLDGAHESMTRLTTHLAHLQAATGLP